MKRNYSILGLTLLLIMGQIGANPTITFFFKPFHENDTDRIAQKLKKPGQLAHYAVHSIIEPSPVAGILATYSGYVTASTYNGEIVFPRKHQNKTIMILVTSEMAPISLLENTILHWTLLPGVAAKMYACEQKYDEVKNYHYWETKVVSLPTDNNIPLATIVIIARPQDIIMDEGITSTVETANLILPDVYVKKGINIVKDSSYMLTIRHLFKPVGSREHREPFKMLTHIID